MAQRIKGQEVQVSVIKDGAVIDAITAVKSIELIFQQEIKDEEYLGETSKRYDSVFNGVTGDAECDLENPDIFDLFDAIVNKSTRRTPGTRFNIKTTLNFTSGKRVRIVLNDIEWGSIPISVGSRSDYVSSKLSFACSKGKFVR